MKSNKYQEKIPKSCVYEFFVPESNINSKKPYFSMASILRKRNFGPKCAQSGQTRVWAKSNRKASIAFSKWVYRQRNLVERFFNELKNYRGIATRYDRKAENFLAAIKLVAVRLWLKFNDLPPKEIWREKTVTPACYGFLLTRESLIPWKDDKMSRSSSPCCAARLPDQTRLEVDDAGIERKLLEKTGRIDLNYMAACRIGHNEIQ